MINAESNKHLGIAAILAAGLQRLFASAKACRGPAGTTFSWGTLIDQRVDLSIAAINLQDFQGSPPWMGRRQPLNVGE